MPGTGLGMEPHGCACSVAQVNKRLRDSEKLVAMVRGRVSQESLDLGELLGNMQPAPGEGGAHIKP